MSMTRSLLTSTAVLVGTSTAMLMGGIAKAEPAPAPSPVLPAISAIEQLANVPAIAPRILQDAASSLTGVPATAPAPAAPSPAASITLPQPSLPGQIGLPQPATVVHPASIPAASPVMDPSQLVPNASMNLPTVPGLPVPLPQQVSLPGDLASLLPGVPSVTPGVLPGTAPAVTPGAVPATVPGVTPSAVPGAFPTVTTGAFPTVTPGAVPDAVVNPSAVSPVTALLPDLITLVPVSGLP